MTLEENNAALWGRVGELRQQCSEQTDVNNKQTNENNILSSEVYILDNYNFIIIMLYTL